MTATPQEIAREIVAKYFSGSLVSLETDIARAIEQARRDALEEAAEVCDAEAKSERRWMLDYEKAFGPDDARVTECSGGWAAAKTLARELRALAGKGDRHG